MSDLTLLEQAKAHARKDGALVAGVSTTDGKSGEAHLGFSARWKRLTAALYAKVQFAAGKKPEKAAGLNVEIDLKGER